MNSNSLLSNFKIYYLIMEEVDDSYKSYESMKSDEEEPLHYNIDSDNEPPKDEVGDKLTIIKKN